MTNRVRYLCISDIHLGHSKNPTRNIVDNLREYFGGYSSKSQFANLDIVFIAGDLFDQLIEAPSVDLYDALEFITDIVSFCERNRIKLRVLEGTPSHDRQQNRLVEAVSAIKSTKGDIKWVKTLSIERMEDLDLSILYVPDEYTSATETTLGLVKDLFREQGIEQVDIAIMHGVFEFQMAGVPGKHDVHDSQEYLKLVKHFINIGHFHVFRNYMRIIGQGSFDRLAQGEEEPKGGTLMTIRDEGEDYYEFIPNLKAKVFKTIVVENPSMEVALQEIETVLKKIPPESYIRIKAAKLHPVFAALPELRKMYPFLRFTKLSFEEEAEQKATMATVPLPNYSVTEITRSNVINMIVEEIPTLTPMDEQKLRGELEALHPL